MNKNLIKEIGHTIRGEWTRRNITTEQAAEMLGHSTRAVELQLDNVSFTEKNAELYARTFGFNKEYLMTGIGSIIVPTVPTDGNRLSVEEMITLIREHLHIKSNAAFAAYIGYSPQRVSACINRGTFNMALLKAKCPELSGDWLLTGRGEMLLSAAEPDAKREAALELAAQLKAENDALQEQNAKLLAVIETLARR